MSCNWFVCLWPSFVIRLHVHYDHLYSTHSPVICLIKTSVAKKVIHTHKKTHPPPEPTIISWSLHRRMKSFSPVHGKHCGRGLIRNSMVSPVPKNWADLECLSWSRYERAKHLPRVNKSSVNAWERNHILLSPYLSLCCAHQQQGIGKFFTFTVKCTQTEKGSAMMNIMNYSY